MTKILYVGLAVLLAMTEAQAQTSVGIVVQTPNVSVYGNYAAPYNNGRVFIPVQPLQVTPLYPQLYSPTMPVYITPPYGYHYETWYDPICNCVRTSLRRN